ncbi:MAG: apolipoprotein N-acyltransferase [Proteobacteria bacterium]|nr:apolipoprotein N-acyltransferase [Pseudomonadota bacterium]
MAERWLEAVGGFSKWRKRFLAYVLGLVSALAFAPVHAIPVLVISFTGLLWLIHPTSSVAPVGAAKRRRLSIFLIGWWFGLGHFMAGLYWISFSFLVDAKAFAWMIPFALGGITGVLAIYSGLAVLLAYMTTLRTMPRILLFAIYWVGFEWIRGWAFTGFPWNLAGTVWTPVDSILQSASVIGVHGLGLLTILIVTLPAVLGVREMSGRSRLAAVGAGLALLAVLWGAGTMRLMNAQSGSVDGVRLRLVQPNIAQKDKWVQTLRARHFQTLLRLSRQPASGAAPTHIIWPETATPLFLSSEPVALSAAASVVPRGGALITGSPRATNNGRRLTGLWNSVHVINDEGRILSTYDKSHLVPFGEYVPFRQYLGFAKVTAGRTDFSPGTGPGDLSIPGLPAARPLICYEAIFPGLSAPVSHAVGAGWLLNLTNDAWFGVSSGPYQHLASTRLRAVEQGMPLVRVANTGVTAVTDAYGRLRVASQLNQKVVLDVDLPEALAAQTVYSRFGDWTALLLGFIIAAMAGIFSLKYRNLASNGF